MPYRVILTVKESRGNCPYYKVGDKITFEEPEIVKEKSDSLSLDALLSFVPYIAALAHAQRLSPVRRGYHIPDSTALLFGIFMGMLGELRFRTEILRLWKWAQRSLNRRLRLPF